MLFSPLFSKDAAWHGAGRQASECVYASILLENARGEFEFIYRVDLVLFCFQNTCGSVSH